MWKKTEQEKKKEKLKKSPQTLTVKGGACMASLHIASTALCRVLIVVIRAVVDD